MKARVPAYAVRYLAACAFLIQWSCASVGARAQSHATEFGRAFDQVWRTVRDHFYDPTMHGVDWQAAAARYRPEAESARSTRAFASVVNRMLGELHASHLGYYTPDDFEFYLLPSVFNGPQTAEACEQIGVMGTRHGDVYEVAAVLEGSPAARAGIVGGDQLVDVQGEPFSTVGAFKGKAGQDVKVTLDRPGRGRMTVTVVPVRTPPRQAFLDATRASVHVIERSGRRIGYVHLWCMTDRAFADELDGAVLGPLADTDALVYDIRDGFGGRPYGYTSEFYTPDVLWLDRPRRQRGSQRARPHHTAYDRPMVLLINGGTRSAKEFVAYQFAKSRRATLIGTKTAGAFLGAGGFAIGKTGYLEVPIDDITLDGARLEGRGVSPDVVVPDKGSYAPGDPQIERAVAYLAAHTEHHATNVPVPARLR